MTDETEVTVYYGPLSWFNDQIAPYDDDEQESLLDIAFRRDESARTFRVVLPDQGIADDDEEEVSGPACVVAESGDYASLNEHVITNFAGLIRSINPKCVYLHNPPNHVHAQLERTFTTKVVRYRYPSVSRDTLQNINERFADYLVGQAEVKNRLLAALYPLTRPRRVKPAVLMFYGPSGVGKTETAQFVNALLGGTLLRKQFSMFHSDKFATYLFGGTHSEPSFARDLLDRESGVILIDEFDKANSVFHSAFYQLFDDGSFEDKNYAVELGNTLIICTSNYGSDKEVRQALGDALYSRFDAVIKFDKLASEEIAQVIDRLVVDRLSKLEDDERDKIDESQLRDILRPLTEESSNVRKLGKTVDEVISLLLVRSLLVPRQGTLAV